MNTQPLSPYRLGADNGFRFAVYLTALYAAMVAGQGVALLGLASMLLMLGVPLFVFMLLRRDRLAPGGLPTVGALWLDGLFTFLGGGLLAGALLFAYLNWINPDYLADNLHATMEMLQASPNPGHQDLAEAFATALDNGFSISPILFTMTQLWMVAASGSVLSLILAVAIMLRHPATKHSNS